jgi:hypothetical protein
MPSNAFQRNNCAAHGFRALARSGSLLFDALEGGGARDVCLAAPWRRFTIRTASPARSGRSGRGHQVGNIVGTSIGWIDVIRSPHQLLSNLLGHLLNPLGVTRPPRCRQRRRCRRTMPPPISSLRSGPVQGMSSRWIESTGLPRFSQSERHPLGLNGNSLQT